MLTERVSALPNRSQAQKKGSMHPSLARKVLRREVQEADLPGARARASVPGQRSRQRPGKWRLSGEAPDTRRKSAVPRAETAVKEAALSGNLEWVEFSVKENLRDHPSCTPVVIVTIAV